MDAIINPTYWLIVGFILIIAELVIPGGVIVFLGAGCLVVAGAIWLGFVTTWVGAMTLFFVSSLVLLISLRSLVTRFAGGDFTESNTIEILDEVGDLVDVIETIGPGNSAGRIEFHGTQWPAVGDGQAIEPGQQARIVSRENLCYIVEKL